MSRRGLLILGAIILVPFFIAGLVRMGCKAARRGGLSSAPLPHAEAMPDGFVLAFSPHIARTATSIEPTWTI